MANPETGALAPGMIPAEFVDRLVDEFLLAPDAEYWWARCAYSAAMASQMSEVPGFDIALLQAKEGRIGPQGIAANLDAAMSSGMGGPLALATMVYPDFIRMVTDPSKQQEGEVIKINRPRYIDGVTTEAAHRISPQQAFFSTAGQVPKVDQVPVTIFECAGPTDELGNLSPINLASFAKQLSKHDLLKMVGLHLRRDRWRYLHYLIETRLADAAATVTGGVTYPDGVSAITDFSGAGNEPTSFGMIVRGEEAMKSRKVPGMENAGRYMALLDIHQVADLQRDPEYQRLSRYHEQYNPLFPGYISTVNNTVIVESNAATRVTNLGPSTNITGYRGFMVAPGVLGWASALAAEPLRDRNDDGGRFNRFGWKAFEGWQVLDDRFVQMLVTD